MKEYLYFKGHRKYPEIGHTEDCVFKVIKNPTEKDKQNEFIHIVHIMDLGSPNGTCGWYDSLEELEQDDKYHISREITKEEYKIYEDLKVILREVYMHGLTGGFPRMETIHSVQRDLFIDIARYEKLYEQDQL